MQATRINQGKVIQIGIYIQCKAMHCHEAAAFHTYGAYFTRSAHSMRLNPDSRRPFKAFPFDSIER